MLAYIVIITVIITCIGLLVDKAVNYVENKINSTNVSDCRSLKESAIRYAATVLVYFCIVYVYLKWKHPLLLNTLFSGSKSA
jgi:hypothetical protein